jgi:hypothetical protein
VPLTQTLTDSASSASIAEAGTGRPLAIRPLGQNISATDTGSACRLGLGPPPLTKPCPPALSGPLPLRCEQLARRLSQLLLAVSASGSPTSRRCTNGIRSTKVSSSWMDGGECEIGDGHGQRTKVAALRAEQLTRAGAGHCAYARNQP